MFLCLKYLGIIVSANLGGSVIKRALPLSTQLMCWWFDSSEIISHRFCTKGAMSVTAFFFVLFLFMVRCSKGRRHDTAKLLETELFVVLFRGADATVRSLRFVTQLSDLRFGLTDCTAHVTLTYTTHCQSLPNGTVVYLQTSN